MEHLTTQLDSIENKISILSKAIVTLQNEKAALGEEHEKILTSLSQERENNTNLRSEIEELKEELAKKEAVMPDVGKWKSQLDNHITMIDDCLEWIKKQ